MEDRITFEDVIEVLKGCNINFAYSTMWSEGVVVRKFNSLDFPIGYNPCNGEVLRVTSLEKLQKVSSFNLIAVGFEDEQREEFDTSGY